MRAITPGLDTIRGELSKTTSHVNRLILEPQESVRCRIARWEARGARDHDQFCSEHSEKHDTVSNRHGKLDATRGAHHEKWQFEFEKMWEDLTMKGQLKVAGNVDQHTATCGLAHAGLENQLGDTLKCNNLKKKVMRRESFLREVTDVDEANCRQLVHHKGVHTQKQCEVSG